MDLHAKLDEIEQNWTEYVRSDHPNVPEIIPMLELGLIRKELTRIANYLESIAKTEVLKANEDGYGDYQ